MLHSNLSDRRIQPRQVRAEMCDEGEQVTAIPERDVEDLAARCPDRGQTAAYGMHSIAHVREVTRLATVAMHYGRLVLEQ